MGNDLDAKYAFAFTIDLESQAAAVQLEDRQIIGRSLDRDFPFGGALLARAIFRTMLAAEDRPDGLQVQQHAAAVNQGLKDLLHVAANLKNQVAAVLDLVVRVLIAKGALASAPPHQARSTNRLNRSSDRIIGSTALWSVVRIRSLRFLPRLPGQRHC